MWKLGFSQPSRLVHRCTRPSLIGTKVLLRPCEGYPKHWKSSLQTFNEKYQCFGSMRKTIHTPSSFGEYACLCCLRNFSWVSEKARQSLAFTEPHSKLRKQQRQACSPKEEGVCIFYWPVCEWGPSSTSSGHTGRRRTGGYTSPRRDSGPPPRSPRHAVAQSPAPAQRQGQSCGSRSKLWVKVKVVGQGQSFRL